MALGKRGQVLTLTLTLRVSLTLTLRLTLTLTLTLTPNPNPNQAHVPRLAPDVGDQRGAAVASERIAQHSGEARRAMRHVGLVRVRVRG